MKATLSTDTVWAHLSTDLRQFIRRRVSDDDAADDLLQETFLRIHRKLGTLRDSDRLAVWVYQIARNVVRDHHRSAASSMLALGDADPAGADPAVEGDQHSSLLPCGGVQWLDHMIETLPPGYREAVRWAEIEGQSQQEVAHKFGMTLSGAKSRIQRGRMFLRQALEECCHLQLDHAGRPMDCSARPGQKICQDCGS
jgi:RNA polymerase sigma-70 factor, ECF subfamily